jgi:hypothetical protein
MTHWQTRMIDDADEARAEDGELTTGSRRHW